MTTPPNDAFDNAGGQPPQQPQYGQQPHYGQQPAGYAGQPQYGQQPYGAYPQAMGADRRPAEEQGSFFSALFDFKFSKMIATRVIPTFYMVITIVITIVAAFFFLVGVVGGFIAMGDSVGGGFLQVILTIVIVPVVYLIYLVLARITLELYIAIFRISQNAARVAENTEK